MHQLVYISTAKTVSDPEVDRILTQSRRNNRRDQITGLLLYNGQRFLQVLEGPETFVELAYERIRVDLRHRAPVLLSAKTVDERQFGQWDMASEREMAGLVGHTALVERVDCLVANVADPNLRAQFTSYVRLQKP